MNYFDYYTDLFDRVYIKKQIQDIPQTSKVTSYLHSLPVHIVGDKENIPPEHLNSRTLFISGPRGETVGHCPGSKGRLCCNYLTVDLYLGCSLGCSYCIMRSYLNFYPLTVYLPADRSIERILEIVSNNPHKTIRIGTGEVGDSLLLDPLFDLSKEFISRLARYPNVYFELKTKTDFVDHLLAVPEKGNTVIGFSLNPEQLISSEEPYAASLERRLAAAEKAVESGYLLSFHFDPIIRINGWEKLYRETALRLGRFPREKIAWISMGTMRYPPQLKERLGNRPYLFDEFVGGSDGKYRYLQRNRIRMYTTVVDAIRRVCGAPVYLCMESPIVWKRVFGGLPSRMGPTGWIFDQPEGVPF